MDVLVAGERLCLLHQHAAYLPGHGLLLVADAHIGKAHAFRRSGLPVPGGTTAEALARLQAALDATGAGHVVFLGDLLHAAQGRAPATLAAVAAWRQARPGLHLTLVRGNHDSHAGDPPPDWGVRCIDGPWYLGPWALAHHPDPLPGCYVLAGHVHPAAVVGGRGLGRLRLPCFHFGPQVGVLPAFGGFTGTHVLPRGPGDRVVVIAGEHLRALDAAP